MMAAVQVVAAVAMAAARGAIDVVFPLALFL